MKLCRFLKNARGEHIVLVRQGGGPNPGEWPVYYHEIRDWLIDAVGREALPTCDVSADKPWRSRVWDYNGNLPRYAFFFYSRMQAIVFEVVWHDTYICP